MSWQGVNFTLDGLARPTSPVRFHPLQLPSMSFLVSLDRALQNDHSIDADHPYYAQNDPYDIATKVAESWKNTTL